jgi:hypothetical protein
MKSDAKKCFGKIEVRFKFEVEVIRQIKRPKVKDGPQTHHLFCYRVYTKSHLKRREVVYFY